MKLILFFFYIITVFVLLTHNKAFAFCPSNGNTHVIYITSNMGDNIWSFDTAGRYIGNVLNKSSFPFRVDKLRDMKFGPENHLYISSARGQYSRIFAVSGNGLLNNSLNRECTRNYLFTATTQNSSNPFLDHPYAMTFDPSDDSLFVSNQNSATITKYIRVDDGKAKFPQWEPIKNIKYTLSAGTGPSNIPDKAGLFASSWSSEYNLASVRGLTLSPPLPRALVEQAAPAGWFASEGNLLSRYILVCDLAMDQVHVFLSQTGEHVFAIPVPSPVQVLFPSRYEKVIEKPASYFDIPHIYITSKEDGMVYLVPFVVPPQQSDVFGGNFNNNNNNNNNMQHHWNSYAVTNRNPQHSCSGIYENPSHDMLLIADRSGRRVSTYASPFLTDYESGKGPSPFLGYFTSKLPDQPEFILSTAVEEQRSIPFCYELSEDGRFRYVALCTAAYIWTWVLLFILFFALIVVIVREVRHCQEQRARKRHHNNKSQLQEMPSSEEIPLIGKTSEKGYGSSK